MTSWHQGEEEASRLRAGKRDGQEQDTPETTTGQGRGAETRASIGFAEECKNEIRDLPDGVVVPT